MRASIGLGVIMRKTSERLSAARILAVLFRTWLRAGEM